MGNQPVGATPRQRSPDPGSDNKEPQAQSEVEEKMRQSVTIHQKAQLEYDYLSKVTHFDENTLRLLHSRFMGIDRRIQEDGQITIEEFADVLCVSKDSLLLQRLFAFMDKGGMGSINFRNFATAMSMLSDKATAKEKMELTFFLYDQNGDGMIDRKELKGMVLAALEHLELKLSPRQVECVVDNTYKACDRNGNGKIEFDEYCKYCEENPRILQPFTMDVSKLIEYVIDESRRQMRYTQKQRTLHHGALEAGGRKTTAQAFKRKVAKGLARVKKDQMVEVKSIHAADDLFADVENVIDGRQDLIPAYLLAAGKAADYDLSGNEDVGYHSETDEKRQRKKQGKDKGGKKKEKDGKKRGRAGGSKG